MHSLLCAAKSAFINSFLRVGIWQPAVPKIHSRVSTPVFSRILASFRGNNQLECSAQSHTCHKFAGADSLNCFPNFSTLHSKDCLSSQRPLLRVENLHNITSRSVTKFSLTKGTKRSVRTVLKRFYRLNNGLWIRRIGGYHKKVYKQSEQDKFRLQQHIVCARYQCEMLDRMVTDFWKKPKYYIDDPYEPYHVRHNLDYIIPFRRKLKRK